MRQQNFGNQMNGMMGPMGNMPQRSQQGGMYPQNPQQNHYS